MAESQSASCSPAIGATNDHNYSTPTTTPDEESWQNLKITKSTDADDKERDFKLLLENTRKSILGDTLIFAERGDKYFLDRAILASKSNHLAKLCENNAELNIGNTITTTVQEDDVLASIFQIMYEKDLKSVITEHNFVDLLKNMCYLEMEVDLETFERFIEETIEPRSEFCHEMVKLYFFMLSSRVFEECRCDYLLPIVSKYLSNRLLEAYKMKEFLSLPFEGLFRILLNTKVYEPEDKGLIGRICAEWICRDFDDRVVKLVKLVDATKHRYEIYHYLGANEVEERAIVDSLTDLDEHSRVEEVEERFNELLSYYGDVKFDSSQLADEISDESRNRIINAIDLPNRWFMFLEKGLLYDVIINVQGITYKLHRIKLLSSSTFFYNLFAKSKNSPDSNIDEKFEKSPIETYTFDEINPVAFEKIVHYIYGREIEITSEDLMINVLKTSHFFQMNDLYEECNMWCLRSTREITRVIFDLFQFVCENEKNTELYDEVTARILDIWPEYDDNAFKNISLKVLKEIVALPDLSLDSADEVVDLCSKWILHDLGKRYPYIHKIAKAVNRNFAPCIKRVKLETPDTENLAKYSVEMIKKHLTQILSSSALVSSNFDPCSEFKPKPHFIAMKTGGTLSILDEYFNEIVSINPEALPVYSIRRRVSIDRQSATIIDDKLFILFHVDVKFHFYVYQSSSNKFISLATDVRMSPIDKYVILNVNGEVLYLEDLTTLKYCYHLNRWIKIFDRQYSPKWYASTGKILFKVSFHKPSQLVLPSLGILKARFYDFKQETWIKLPDVPVRPSLVTVDPVKWNNLPITVNVIENDFCVLFKRKTYVFHWKTQTWSSIDNLYEDFTTFTERDQNILYISAKNGVQLYSPVRKEWISDQKLNNFKSIIPIHTIMK